MNDSDNISPSLAKVLKILSFNMYRFSKQYHLNNQTLLKNNFLV